PYQIANIISATNSTTTPVMAPQTNSLMYMFNSLLHLLHVLRCLAPGTPQPFLMAGLGFVAATLVGVHLIPAVRAAEPADVYLFSVLSGSSWHFVYPHN